jgi:hypothetical protein
MRLRRAQPTESREIRQWIVERHYLRSAPPGFVVALEFVDDAGDRIGAALLGRPTSRSLDAEQWLELTRLFFVDEAPKNTESRALALMRKWVRTWLPKTKALLAYSDPAVGHDGTIYRADGWASFGQTQLSKRGWRNRPGRAGNDTPSRKTRWVRTP